MKFIGNYKESIVVEDFSSLDLPEKRQHVYHTITKFEPGKLVYTHKDQFISTAKNPVKYVMFLNDWSIGHIFTFDGSMLADYKLGDVYQLDNNSDIIYTQANISYEDFSIIEIKFSDSEQI